MLRIHNQTTDTYNSSTIYILMHTLIIGPVIDQTVGINCHGVGMLYIQLDIGRRICAESCGWDILFSTDDPSFGSDAERSWMKLSNTINIEMDLDISNCFSKRIKTTKLCYCVCLGQIPVWFAWHGVFPLTTL